MTTATQTKIPPAPRWDLDSIFPGGSKSKEFAEFRSKVKTGLESIQGQLASLPAQIDKATLGTWTKFVIDLQSQIENTELVMAFAGCLCSQDVSDTEADKINAEGDVLYSEWKKLETELEAISLKQSDDQWAMLTSTDELKEIAFYLNELRKIAASKMPLEKESLAIDLAVDGFHSWNRMYDKMAGELRVDFEEAGETKSLSLGQLATKMSDPNRSIRKQAFEKMTEAWKSRQDLAAITLNSLAGFRLALNKNRKWESPLFEPLVGSRMKEETLNAMWSVIRRETPRLGKYIDAKKQLLGIDKFSWYDQSAPVGNSEKLYPYNEAETFIYENMKPFSTDMAEFAKMAMDKNWVEAEDRPGKRGGGFCTGTGPLRQSRIFMTYAGTYENLLTLAHELGHAYHSHVLKSKPFFATDYPMNLAETASTFAELLVTDAALAQTTDKAERLMLLDQKLQGTYTMFCDIQSRFIFDKAFHAERADGVVTPARLNELMVESQKTAFAGLLDESGYHPYFWCSKLHFYLTGQPFYNFPYTFGFLFSAGVYAQAQKEGAAFADKYAALLADTGSMTTEEVARKHLGVDLTGEEFWTDAVNLVLADIDPFVELIG